MPAMEASDRSRRRAERSAQGWHEGTDGRWRRELEGAEFVPECSAARVLQTVVRDAASGVVIHDSSNLAAGSRHKRGRTFRKPRNVVVCVDVDFVGSVVGEEVEPDDVPLEP